MQNPYENIQIILFGTMGDIAEHAMTALAESDVMVEHVDFAQNTLRDEPGYKRELIKAIRQHPADQKLIILPIGNTTAISRIAPEIRLAHPNVSIAVETSDKVELLDSKVRLYEYAQSLGISLPHRYMSTDEVAEGQRVIFKKDISFAGQGVRIPGSRAALENIVRNYSCGRPFLIEDFIDGDEYSVDVVRYDSYTRASTYRCTSTHGTHPAKNRSIEARDDLEKIACKILNTLDYNGICGFDFIVDASGQSFLLEANPRLTGGISTQLSAGFNIPLLIVTHLNFRKCTGCL